MIPIVKYFNGEKAESYLFILVGVIALAIALYVIFVLKTSFWRGVAIPFFIVGLLEFVVGYTILTRTPQDIIRVENIMGHEQHKIKTEEIPRMEKVLSNFVIFRYVEIVLIVLGILFMYSSKNDTLWKGVGLGLFIQVSIVLGLDFFAERRGSMYMSYLKDYIDKL